MMVHERSLAHERSGSPLRRALQPRPPRGKVKWAIRIALVLACWLVADRAAAQLALSAGPDVGLTSTNPHIGFVDRNTRWNNPVPSAALGIDIAWYWLPSPTTALGFAMTAAAYRAGPGPSGGLNFVLGPRFVWRPGPVHLALSAGYALSTYNGLCDGHASLPLPDCPRTRSSEPAAPGFGVGLASLVRVWSSPGEIDLLVGPSLRYQWAHYDEEGTKGFAMPVFQAVLAVQIFVAIIQ